MKKIVNYVGFYFMTLDGFIDRVGFLSFKDLFLFKKKNFGLKFGNVHIFNLDEE